MDPRDAVQRLQKAIDVVARTHVAVTVRIDLPLPVVPFAQVRLPVGVCLTWDNQRRGVHVSWNGPHRNSF